MWVWWFKGDGLGHRWKCIVVVVVVKVVWAKIQYIIVYGHDDMLYFDWENG
jgi:hypothetical protein